MFVRSATKLPSLPPAIELHAHRIGEGRPVLALHDLGQTGTVVAEPLTALGHDFRIIAPDLRGHGGSPTPGGPWSIDDFASDVARVVTAEGGQAIVVGVGLGAATALALALGHPGLVSGLVLSGVSPRSEEPEGQERWIRAARGIRERLGEAGEGIALAAEAMGTRPDWRGALPQIESPAVVLAGGEDRAVPADTQRELSVWIRGARYELLEGAGHDVIADATGDVLEAVRRLAGCGSEAVAA
jgi:pimeloyl-ACP methyl ester carboxylesterase